MSREPRIPGLRRVVRTSAASVQRDVSDEIAFHIETRVRELMAAGKPEADARLIAEAEFGDVDASRRELAALEHRRRRRLRLADLLDEGARDLRYAGRALRRSPGFAATAMLTLVIGIGSSVAIFALVNGVLLRPLPYRNADRLVGAWHDMSSIGLARQPQAPATYFTYAQLAHTIDGIGIYRDADVNVAQPGGGGEPERMTSAKMSASLGEVLGTPAAIGRTFSADDDRPGATPVALISAAMWRARFGGDQAVIGRSLDVDGVTRRIIGVMPSNFQFPSAATQLWIPLQLDPVNPPPTAFAYPAVARLKAGVSLASAQRDFTTVLPRAAELFPRFVPGITTAAILEQAHPKPVLVPLKTDITGQIAGVLWTIAAAAGLLLLVAGTNVANLVLVRASARQRELTLREALGAGRVRVMMHFLAESSVLVVVASVVALAAAFVTVRLVIAADPAGIPRLSEVRIDGASVLFTLALDALLIVGCSVIPALRFGGGALASREGGRAGTAGRAQHRLRGALVATQIALALVALAGAGLLLRSFERLRAVKPGFDVANVSTFWVSLPPSRYKGDTSIVGFYSRLVDRAAALPGVTAVGLTSRLPLEPYGINPNPLYPESDGSYATKLPPLELFTTVGGNYFRAIGIPLVAGRGFDAMAEQHEGEAVVSLATARLFWHDSTGAAALSKRFRPLPGGRAYTVIGVVGDARDTALAAPASPTVYLPALAVTDGGDSQARRAMALVLKTTGASTATAPAVRRIVRDLDPTLPVFEAKDVAALLAQATRQLRFLMLILGGAAMATLALAVVGLYGVLAYLVTLRTREFGIRIALGASTRRIVMGMVRYGVGLTVIGSVAGLALFALVARFLVSFVFGVRTRDPLTLGASVVLLMAIAALASWLPARRASRVDPADALRAG